MNNTFPNSSLLDWKTYSPQNMMPILQHFSLPHVRCVIFVAQRSASLAGKTWLLLSWDPADHSTFSL